MRFLVVKLTCLRLSSETNPIIFCVITLCQVFLAFCIVKSNGNVLPIDERSQHQTVKPNLLKEISLKLLPPDLPRDHHHHQHHYDAPSSTQASSSVPTPSPPRKPQVEIVRYEYKNLPDGGYKFLWAFHDDLSMNPERSATSCFVPDMKQVMDRSETKLDSSVTTRSWENSWMCEALTRTSVTMASSVLFGTPLMKMAIARMKGQVWLVSLP